MAAKEFGFTESHQLAINVTNFGIAKDIAHSLYDKNNIISELRIGVQEITRYGIQENEMGELAALMKTEREGKLVKDEVLRLRNRFTDIHFS